MSLPPPRDGALRVMVTGATGFVGLHTARALAAAGHELRLLVRDPDKADRVLGPHGLGEVARVVGDMTDAAAVARALEGCDAVVHAAAQVNLYAADAARTVRANLGGAEAVIGAAVERGVSRVVAVSSGSVLMRPGLARIDEDTPLLLSAEGYSRSKQEAELAVRALQAAGAPIYTTYPGVVMGPEDPGQSEGTKGLRAMIAQGCVITSGGLQIVDVRDLADVHRALIERGGPPARYVVGGHYLPWAALADRLDEITGAKIRRLRLPLPLLRLLGQAGDLAYRIAGVELPISQEAVTYAAGWTPMDDSRLRRELDVRWRDVRETLTDAVRWLADQGMIGGQISLRR